MGISTQNGLGYSERFIPVNGFPIYFSLVAHRLDELRLWDTDHGYDAAISALETSLKKMKAQPARPARRFVGQAVGQVTVLDLKENGSLNLIIVLVRMGL